MQALSDGRWGKHNNITKRTQAGRWTSADLSLLIGMNRDSCRPALFHQLTVEIIFADLLRVPEKFLITLKPGDTPCKQHTWLSTSPIFAPFAAQVQRLFIDREDGQALTMAPIQEMAAQYHALQNRFRQIADECFLTENQEDMGMAELRFHDLRHTYAVNSLRAGDDIKTVQENLGHSTASFTLSTYAHATPGMKRESANRMNQFIHNLTESH